MNRILIVEDDIELNSTLSVFLRSRGFAVSSAHDVNEAWDEIAENKPSLIISDIMMPNVNGFEFVRMVREEDNETPFLFISARDDMEAKSRGFNEGIDDYMVKPINFEELLLRISALLRRASIKQIHRLELDGFVMDEEERSVYINGEEIPFTQKEFDILYKLLSYPKKTFTRARLMDEFWSADSAATLRTVDVFITRIRDKVSNCPSFEIQTVRGLGYKAVVK